MQKLSKVIICGTLGIRRFGMFSCDSSGSTLSLALCMLLLISHDYRNSVWQFNSRHQTRLMDRLTDFIWGLGVWGNVERWCHLAVSVLIVQTAHQAQRHHPQLRVGRQVKAVWSSVVPGNTSCLSLIGPHLTDKPLSHCSLLFVSFFKQLLDVWASFIITVIKERK